jgi:hypothetical protein
MHVEDPEDLGKLVLRMRDGWYYVSIVSNGGLRFQRY